MSWITILLGVLLSGNPFGYDFVHHHPIKEKDVRVSYDGVNHDCDDECRNQIVFNNPGIGQDLLEATYH